MLNLPVCAGCKLTRILDSRYINLLRIDPIEDSRITCTDVQSDLSVSSKLITLIPDPMFNEEFINCWDYVSNESVTVSSYSFLLINNIVIDVLLSDTMLSLEAYMTKIRELNPKGIAFVIDTVSECFPIEHITNI